MFLLIFLLLISLVVIVILIAVGTLLYLGVRPSYRSYRLTQKIPGPPGLYVLGNALLVLRVNHANLMAFLVEMFKVYKLRFKIWILGINVVVLRDADDIKCVLNSTENIKKGLDYVSILPWLEEGLLVSSGQKWHKRRKMLTPAFHFKILEDNIQIFNQCSKELAEDFIKRRNEDVEMEHCISKCTLKVIMKAAMGIDINEVKGGDRYIKELITVSEIFSVRHLNPLLYNETIFNMTKPGIKMNKGVRYLQEFSSNIIKERKLKYKHDTGVNTSTGKVRKAFLDLMLDVEMNDPGSLTDKGIREEVDTFMFEGHDTTASALNFIFYNLARHQDVQDRVYSELYEIFGDDDRDITNLDLQNMNYLEQVIKESLRLFPSVPAISRFFDKDLTLTDGTIIPARADVICLIFLLHKNEKYWENPEKFDPERFSDENIRGRHPYCYVPFSAGPRNCIGQKFAMMELKTVVANVIRRLKILPVTKPEDVKLAIFLVLRTLKPIKCKFILRK